MRATSSLAVAVIVGLGGACSEELSVIVNGDPDPERSDLPPYGAGEASHKPMIAAVANAVYDATGVRLRRAPFRREHVLAALRSAET